MAQQTVLYSQHLNDHAKMVDFHGWMMPLHYGSQLDEHHHVRRNVGMFDVSHMTVIDVIGPDAQAMLRYVLANDVAKLDVPGKALYSAMLNPEAGVIDDLICYYLMEQHYRLIVNAATRTTVLAWLQQQASHFAVQLQERPDLAMIALQGPNAATHLDALLTPAQRAQVQAMPAFCGLELGPLFVANTGYTGELGYEILVSKHQADAIWQTLRTAGVPPIGLGARDTLRLEAGLNLYGQEMDQHTSPLAANMGWTIAWEPNERNFIGRQALSQQQEHLHLVGIALTEKGILRQGMILDLVDHQGTHHQGHLTSGGFSPTLGHAIALARVPLTATEIAHATVQIRSRTLPVAVVRPNFVRHGKAVF